LNDWVQAAKLLALFVGGWFAILPLSMGSYVKQDWMRDDMPAAIRSLHRLALKRGPAPGLGSALYGTVFIGLFILPPILLLDPFIGPSSVPDKIVSALYLVAVGLWFAYLFRLVRRGPGKR
jgi:hypothetical protein